ncbi:ATP-binding protein [Paenibacillus validus]|uniref:ATP-binding protein n=1 Tax=Paenibacillus validus TaxID=44253 RepID=UPI0018C3401E|nr:ATP-binding protein [Paenibacillus validus]
MSHSPRKALKEMILEYSKELRLPMIRKHLEEQIQEATQRDASYEEFLTQLLEKECDARRCQGRNKNLIFSRVIFLGFSQYGVRDKGASPLVPYSAARGREVSRRRA